MSRKQACLEALQRDNREAVYGKGGFWVRGEGFFTLAQIAKQYQITAETRNFRGRISAYGDYATIQMISGAK